MCCFENAFTKVAACFLKILIYILFKDLYAFTKVIGGIYTISGIVPKDGLSEVLLDGTHFAVYFFTVINQSRMDTC